MGLHHLGKRIFVYVIKDFDMGGLLQIILWGIQCNHMVLRRGRRQTERHKKMTGPRKQTGCFYVSGFDDGAKAHKARDMGGR